MKCSISVVVLVLLGAFFQSDARQLGFCQLVYELRWHGIPEDQMRDWVCLVEHESLRSTHAIGTLNWDGSWDHGIFQINDRYWCNRGDTPGKECNFTCKDLRNDDLWQAVACAKKIHSRHGFWAWTGWKNYCQGAKPDISHCG